MTIQHVGSFLREYEELCLKYGLKISGCGCCGSPFIESMDSATYFPYWVEDIRFNEENKLVIGIDEQTIDEWINEEEERQMKN